MSNWSFRLMQEEKVSTSAYFLTLTYAPEYTRITKNGFMGLSKDDFQRFVKRLRKRHEGNTGKPLKYYAVGEYGGRFKRPHFHVILFNADIEKIIPKKYANAITRGEIKLDGRHPMDCLDWHYGHCTVGTVSEASIGYTLIYISKPSRIPEHRNDDREREFGLMSKGLGANYLTKAMRLWHKADMEGRQYVALADGKKASLPRYYRNLLLNDEELQELATLRMFDLLFKIDEVEHGEKLTSRERSEAFYAGIDRMAINYKKSQKL